MQAIHGAIQALEGAVTMSGMEGAGGRLLVQGAVMSLEALAQDASAAGAMGKLARGEVPGLEALFGALGAGGNAGDTALLQLVVNLIRWVQFGHFPALLAVAWA